MTEEQLQKILKLSGERQELIYHLELVNKVNEQYPKQRELIFMGENEWRRDSFTVNPVFLVGGSFESFLGYYRSKVQDKIDQYDKEIEKL